MLLSKDTGRNEMHLLSHGQGSHNESYLPKPAPLTKDILTLKAYSSQTSGNVWSTSTALFWWLCPVPNEAGVVSCGTNFRFLFS